MLLIQDRKTDDKGQTFTLLGRVSVYMISSKSARNASVLFKISPSFGSHTKNFSNGNLEINNSHRTVKVNDHPLRKLISSSSLFNR